MNKIICKNDVFHVGNACNTVTSVINWDIWIEVVSESWMGWDTPVVADARKEAKTGRSLGPRSSSRRVAYRDDQRYVY